MYHGANPRSRGCACPFRVRPRPPRRRRPKRASRSSLAAARESGPSARRIIDLAISFDPATCAALRRDRSRSPSPSPVSATRSFRFPLGPPSRARSSSLCTATSIAPSGNARSGEASSRTRAFVVCPRGVPRPDAPKSLDRWTYGKGTDVRAEIEAALTSLRTRFSGYVAEGPILYAGFSLGAIHGVGIVASDGQRFPRAVLVEGGHDGWTPARAKSFAAAGGKRVLFACGQRACKTGAAPARKNLEREGITTQLVFGGEVGHTYDGPVAAEIARVFSWLVADDPRFAE